MLELKDAKDPLYLSFIIIYELIFGCAGSVVSRKELLSSCRAWALGHAGFSSGGLTSCDSYVARV